MANPKRAYIGNKFCLELQNTLSGWLYNAEGGQAQTESVNERAAGVLRAEVPARCLSVFLVLRVIDNLLFVLIMRVFLPRWRNW